MFPSGAIFSKNSTDLDEKVFKFAISSINKLGFLSNITLNYSVKYAALDNSFENIYSGKYNTRFTVLQMAVFVMQLNEIGQNLATSGSRIYVYLNTSYHISLIFSPSVN